jgi:peroxiredoxin
MTAAAIARAALRTGARLPDFELTDHAGNRRRLSDLVAGDPAVLQFFRGWWCPKEQAFLRRLLELQDDMEVAYARMISVSVDPPEVDAAFRAGLGARWTFRSDPDRTVQRQLGCARRPTRSTIRTRPPCSRRSPTSPSGGRSTATGNGGARRLRSCAPTRARSARTGSRRRH